MIPIKIEPARREIIMKIYFESVSKWMKGKSGPRGDSDAKEMFKYFNNNLKEIVCCPPGNLESIHDTFRLLYNKNDHFTTYMKTLYSKYMSENGHAYKLLEGLDVKVCPYCNRSYTTFVRDGKGKVRPDFDHFLSEEAYPLLTLSFYNLIPSCHQCNRLKSTIKFVHNPWLDYSAVEKPQFKVNTHEDKVMFPPSPEIILENESDDTKHLLIKELYNKAHIDYVRELLDRIQSYSNPEVFLSVTDAFQGIATPSELQRIVWGNYVNDGDYDKRPLAKLTGDILDQYGIRP